MARQYKRDARGRFASGGGGGSSRPARKAAPTRAGNRLNRDNSGRITGIGRDGATARGGRLKTASGGRRATQTASLRSPGFRSGTIAKGGRGVSGSVARSLAAVKRGRGAAGSAATKTYSKVDRSVDAIRRRRTRAMAERSSISPSSGFSMARTFRSMVTRSAANAIYNRQRATTKALSKDGKVADEVLRSGIGVMGGLSGNKRNRADQLRESARKRVIAGRRGRR